HPPVRAVEMRPRVRVKNAERVIVLVDNRKVARALKNLQGSRKISRAGNTGLKALDRRIGSRSISKIFLSLRKRLRFVRNLSIGWIDDDAPGGSDAPFRSMAFDIDIGRIAHLPDAAKVRRLAVRQAGWRERGATPLRLCASGQNQRCDHSAD